jgi:predicted permease
VGGIIFSLALVAAGLALGYLLQKLFDTGVLKPPIPVKILRRRLQQVALLGLNPVAFLGAVWIAPIRSVRIAALPLVGLVAILSGGFFAWLISRGLRLDKRRAGSFVTCGAFTNIGSIGALVVFLVLGEAAFALVPFYKLLEELLYYGVGFPVARAYAGHSEDAGGTRVSRLLRDPFIIAALLSIGIGYALNLTGVPRPGWYGPLNALLIPAASVLLLISIGLAMRFSRMRPYLGLGAAVAGIKFLLVPATAVGLAALLGLGSIEGGAPLRVVMILSAMPTGFIALVPPTLYDLDIDLSNTAWLLTTLGLVLMIPALWLLTGLI